MTRKTSALLLVANWESGVGYAWWLIESYWAVLAERFSGQHDVIVSFPRITTLSKQMTAAPLRAVTLDMNRSGPRALVEQCMFLRRAGVRLLYCSDWDTWRLRYVAYRLSGVRTIVVHDHTPGLRTPPTAVKRIVKMLLNRAPWLAADAAFAATEFVRKRLVEVTCFPPERCFTVPNGLPDLPTNGRGTRQDLKDELAIPPGRAVVVMTGRANRYKGVAFAIACIAELVAKGRSDVQFLFVGDGPDLADFVRLADELGVAAYCTFAGRRDDVARLLFACDLAFHPSSGEVGYSLSILEYMRAGLPVIVPDNPSVSGAIESGITGIVYRDREVTEATAAIESLLDDVARRRTMGDRAQRVVQEEYRLERTHAALLSAAATLPLR